MVDSVRRVGQPLSVKGRPHSAVDGRLVWDGLGMEANGRWNLEETAEDIHAAFQVFAGWVDLASSARSQQPNAEEDESRWYDLRDTLLEHHGSEEGNEELVALNTSFWPWYEAIRAFSAQAVRQGSAPSASSLAWASFLALAKDAGSRFQLKMMANCQRKRLIVTGDNVLGLAPDVVEAGDVVALIAGLHMPVILRPTSQGHYHYVCHAYIYGLMDDEKWQKSNASVRGLWLG